MKDLIKRLRNPGTIMTLVSSIVGILVLLGVNIDTEKVMGILELILIIAAALGITVPAIVASLNDPNTPGIDKVIKK